MIKGKVVRCLLLFAVAVLPDSGCHEKSSGPTYAGMKVEYVIPGNRVSPIVIHGDTAFMAMVDNSLQAFLVSSGRVLWTTRLRESQEPHYLRDLVSTTDLLILGLGQSVVAVRRIDGSVAWRYSDPESGFLAQAGVATDSNYVAFAQSYNEATVLDARTGAVVWRKFFLPKDPLAFTLSPTVANGIVTYQRRANVAMPPDGEPIVVAFRATDGTPVWSINLNRAERLDDWGAYSTLVLGNTLYFALGSGRVAAASRESGAVRWVTEPPAGDGGATRYFSLAANELIAAFDAAPGGAESLDLQTGAVNWRYESSSGGPASAFAVGATVMAFPAIGGQLAVIDRATRSTHDIWPQDLIINGKEAWFYWTPTAVGDLILAPSAAGLVALRRVR